MNINEIRTGWFRIMTIMTVLALLAPGAFAGKKDQAPEQSGFLSDYSKLGPDPEKRSDWIYRNPDMNLANYDALLIVPFQFYFYPDDQPKGFDAEKMGELGKTFNETFLAELEKLGAVLVDEPGPGVLKCRFAITNLNKTKSAQRLLPQTRIAGTGRGGATMEAECADSITEEVYAQVVNEDKGSRKTGAGTYSGAQSAIKKWAERMVVRMKVAKEADDAKAGK